AALGPAETAQVRDLVRQLKAEGIGIFLISHDIHDVYDLWDRISVMYHGRLVGTVQKDGSNTDEILAMIIMGKKPGEVTSEDMAALHTCSPAARAGMTPPRPGSDCLLRAPDGRSAPAPGRARGRPRGDRGTSPHSGAASRGRSSGPRLRSRPPPIRTSPRHRRPP